ncbi:MAG: hypothetical protein WD875_04170 [Pirellulales bacterium]
MKVTFDLARQSISIEGDSDNLLSVLAAVRDVAPALTQISILTTPAGKPSSPPPPANSNGQGNGDGSAPASDLTGQTLRQFARGLQLDNASERIAAIAYYEKTNEDRQSFSAKQMDEWFGLCGFQKPSQMPVAIFDAKRKYGYIETAGHGQSRIARGGENLVIGKMNKAEGSCE